LAPSSNAQALVSSGCKACRIATWKKTPLQRLCVGDREWIFPSLFGLHSNSVVHKLKHHKKNLVHQEPA
jgi:hypothetical protein